MSSDQLTAERIAELRRLAEAATPGPWTFFPREQSLENPLGRREGVLSHKQNGGGAALGRMVIWDKGDDGNNDGNYIAACDPQTVLALCDLAARTLAAEAERDCVLKDRSQKLGRAVVVNWIFHVAARLDGLGLQEAAKILRKQSHPTPEDVSAMAERDKLQAFKDWVHNYLDTHGVPYHPPGIHGAGGCRIGDRMDWLIAEWDRLTAENSKLREYQDVATSQVKRAQFTAGNAQEQANRLAAENAQLRRDLEAAVDTNAHADLVRLLASNPGHGAAELVQKLTAENAELRDLTARLASALESMLDCSAKGDIEAVTALNLWRAYCDRSEA